MVSPEQFKRAYEHTVGKLNKMFYRSKNCRDAAAQFRELQHLLQREAADQFAAFCCLAVGRCEEAMGNTWGAASEYSFVGTTFQHLQLEHQRCGVPGWREHILEATLCFLMAVECYHESGMYNLCGCILLELGTALLRLHEFEGAELHIRRAAEILQGDNQRAAAAALGLVVECQLEQGRYADAARTAETVCQLASTVPRRGRPSRNGVGAVGAVHSQQWIGEACFQYACLLLLTGDVEQAKRVAEAQLVDPGTTKPFLAQAPLPPVLSPLPSSPQPLASNAPLPDAAAPLARSSASASKFSFIAFRSPSRAGSRVVASSAPVVVKRHEAAKQAVGPLLGSTVFVDSFERALQDVALDRGFFFLVEAFLFACIDEDADAVQAAADELTQRLRSHTQRNLVQLLCNSVCG